MRKPSQTPRIRESRSRRAKKGAELMEFTLTFLPFLAMVFLLLNVAWAVFVKATLEYAVRTGVRSGITITGTQAQGTDLTAMVKNIVQSKSLGLLRGSSGLSKIKVRYFRPPSEGSTANATDVSAQADGNSPSNIMQVSVEGYSIAALLPRLFSWKQAMDTSAVPVAAVAADVIEPSRDVPLIGAAP
jgi:Flp pilus assembly protein TadG